MRAADGTPVPAVRIDRGLASQGLVPTWVSFTRVKEQQQCARAPGGKWEACYGHITRLSVNPCQGTSVGRGPQTDGCSAAQSVHKASGGNSPH